MRLVTAHVSSATASWLETLTAWTGTRVTPLGRSTRKRGQDIILPDTPGSPGRPFLPVRFPGGFYSGGRWWCPRLARLPAPGLSQGAPHFLLGSLLGRMSFRARFLAFGPWMTHSRGPHKLLSLMKMVGLLSWSGRRPGMPMDMSSATARLPQERTPPRASVV